MTVAIVENRQDVDRLEGIIQTNLQSFVEVAHALKEIRDKKYYCDVLGFRTFESYCQKRWEMGRRYMNRMIAAGDVVDNLGPMDPKPTNERQVRPLTVLAPELQRQVWQNVLESVPDGKITERKVIQAVKAIAPRNGVDDEQPTELKDTGSIEEAGSRHLDLLKKHWKAATPADRDSFRRWVRESEPMRDSELVKVPCVVCKCHENQCFSMQDTETDDVDEAGLHAA